MKPWFENEAEIIKFPEPKQKVIKMPNVAEYPDFITGVLDLQARRDKGQIGQSSYDRLYQDLIQRFMKRESFANPWFMRESTLNEATGISGRRSGDIFQKIGDPKQSISFDMFKAYPTNSMKFDNAEQMKAQLDDIESKVKGLVQVNTPNQSQLAFGLAVFDSSKGKVGFVKFGRDVQQVNNPGWWKNNQIPGYEPFFKTAKKATSGFDPRSIFGTGTSKKTALNPTQVVNQVSKVLGPDLAEPIANMIKTKTLPTFENQAENLTAIRDHLAEVFGPIALVTNAQNITGPYREAEKYLGESFSSCNIFYPTQQANPLTDSYLIAKNGKEMGVSSKGAKGANASIFNLAKNIKELAEKDSKNPLLKKYKFTADVLSLLDDENYIEGPIQLAEKVGLINPKTAQMVRSLWTPKSEEKDINKFPGLKKIYNLYTFDKGPEDRKFKLRFAILANLAKAVAQKVNTTKGFGEGALNFLNQSQIIQAYTQTKKVGNDVVVYEIKTIYPPNFQGTLILNGGKNYYSTNAVGKIAFDFKPL